MINQHPGIFQRRSAKILVEMVYGRGTCTCPFIEVVAAELNGRVWDNADAVGAIAAHKAPPPLLSPHLGQGLSDGKFVGISSDALYLHENFEALQRRDDGSGYRTRDAAGAECGNDGLGDAVSELFEAPLGRGWW